MLRFSGMLYQSLTVELQAHIYVPFSARTMTWKLNEPALGHQRNLAVSAHIQDRSQGVGCCMSMLWTANHIWVSNIFVNIVMYVCTG